MTLTKEKKRILALIVIASMLFSMSFTESYAASSGMKLKNYNAPSKIAIGNTYSIKGKIKSSRKIYKVQIGIVSKKTGKFVYRYTKTKVNSYTFNIKKADKKLKFGRLKAGAYYYRISVRQNGRKAKRLLNKTFYVIDNRASSTSITTPESPGLKLSGCNAPGTYSVGKVFAPKGTVKSSSKINKVEVGVVFEPTNKWTKYKYTANVDAKTFDLARTASKLNFSKLPGGDFRYRMYAHTNTGVKLVFDKKFKVIPSSKPKQAVKWAVNIANDDTFNYGAKPIANAIGCYFCKTNHKKVAAAKGDKRYEKTYVCLTFVGAAYAHGAKDAEILNKCSRGKMTMYETNDNFSKFSCWMKIGSCRDLDVKDLQPGDVIIKWSDHNDNSGHVCMYIGGNDIVESSGGGWSANSIGVKHDVASSRLSSLGKNSKKNYVMRYTK